MKNRTVINFSFKAWFRSALGIERMFELLKHFVAMRCFMSLGSFGMTKCFKASSESPAPATPERSGRKSGGNAQKKTIRDFKAYKIRAGALQFVVFISVVIAIFLAAFVLLTHTHTFFKKQSYAVTETVKNAGNGMDYALVNHIVLNDTVAVVVFEENGQNVRLHRSWWGVFEKVMAISENKHKRFVKTALTGGQYTLRNRPALYLRDKDKPLILVGDTRIEGIAYLPDAAVRPGNIAGHAYHGSSLLYGPVRKSVSQLPPLPQELTVQLDIITQQGFIFNDNDIVEPPEDGLLTNAFTKSVQYVYSPGVLDLSGLSITGNIVVYAEKKIVVSASCKLNDVLLAAPEIEIRDGVSGTFQAIASNKIEVGKNVILHYPSALALKAEKNEEENAQHPENGIVIGENSVVKGPVLFLGQEDPKNFSAQVVLESGAAVYGELYCSGNISLKGAVHGSVYASNFIVRKSGGIYQNHIFNGLISGEKLPEAYTGLSFENTKKNIVKWLY